MSSLIRLHVSSILLTKLTFLRKRSHFLLTCSSFQVVAGRCSCRGDRNPHWELSTSMQTTRSHVSSNRKPWPLMIMWIMRILMMLRTVILSSIEGSVNVASHVKNKILMLHRMHFFLVFIVYWQLKWVSPDLWSIVCIFKMAKGHGSPDSSDKKRKVSGPNGTCGSRPVCEISHKYDNEWCFRDWQLCWKRSISVGSFAKNLQVAFELDTI